MAAINLDVNERSELRLAIRAAITERGIPEESVALLTSAYQKLAEPDGLRGILPAGAPTPRTFVPIGDAAAAAVARAASAMARAGAAVDEEARLTAQAVAGLGDRLAGLTALRTTRRAA